MESFQLEEVSSFKEDLEAETGRRMRRSSAGAWGLTAMMRSASPTSRVGGLNWVETSDG